MELSLTSLGLMIASCILFAAVFSLLFLQDRDTTLELSGIASRFCTEVNNMDLMFLENSTQYYFPVHPQYTISLSTEYIHLSQPRSQNKNVTILRQFLIHPLPCNHSLNPDWSSGDQFHNNFLLSCYHHTGSRHDPIDYANISRVQQYLYNLTLSLQKTLSTFPLMVEKQKPVVLEKIMVYYDSNGNGLWEKASDTFQEFVFLYQDQVS